MGFRCALAVCTTRRGRKRPLARQMFTQTRMCILSALGNGLPQRTCSNGPYPRETKATREHLHKGAVRPVSLRCDSCSILKKTRGIQSTTQAHRSSLTGTLGCFFKLMWWTRRCLNARSQCPSYQADRWQCLVAPLSKLLTAR